MGGWNVYTELIMLLSLFLFHPSSLKTSYNDGTYEYSWECAELTLADLKMSFEIQNGAFLDKLNLMLK